MSSTTHTQQSEVKDERTNLPKFRKTSLAGHVYKLCSDGNYIGVCRKEGRECIEVEIPKIVLSFTNEDCTESEFMDAYKRVSEVLMGRAI